MAAEIVEEDNVPLIEGGRQLGLDIDVEGGAGHRSIEHPGGGQAAKPQACNERLRSPSPKRRQSPKPFSAQRAAAQPGHFRVG